MLAAEVKAAATADEIRMAQKLLLEYWESFGFDPSFQDFSTEVSNLPGSYASPGGRMGLAMVEGEPAGCIAFRRIDDSRCEAKRLFVRSKFRGRGIARNLFQWLIAEARAAGYTQMVGDTLPSMPEALAMYERLGFRRIGPYSERPTAGAIYLSLALASG